MKVLVVDDDAAGRYLLRSIILAAGYEVVEARDGEEALAAARQDMPDVVITDILMPRMDGYQLCRVWKSDPVLSTVPVAFYTASYTDPADERFALSLGADAFWRKPLDPEILLTSLEELAGLHEPRAVTRTPQMTDEKEILHAYSERLVSKLEEKAVSLTKANAELRRALELLAEEVAVKGNLISELSSDVLARKKVERDLRSERDFTRKMMEFTDLFLSVVDANGVIMLFSEGAARITGYSSDHAVGRSFDELLVMSLESDGFEQMRARVGESQEPLRFVAPIRRKDGSTRLIDFSVSPSFDATGELISLSAFGLDVTESRHGESVEQLVAATDRAVLLGRPGNEVFKQVCDMAAELFGFAFVWIGLRDKSSDESSEVVIAASSLEGTRFLESVATPEDGSPRYPLVEQVLHSGKSVNAFIDSSMSSTWALATEQGYVSALAVPLVAEGSTSGAIVFCSRDRYAFDSDFQTMLERLAERIGLSGILIESQSQLLLQSAALESAVDAIAITDGNQRIEWANNAFVRLMGSGDEEVLGESMRSFSPDDETYIHVLRLLEEARSGACAPIEVLGLRRDGGRFYERLSVTRVQVHDRGERFIWISQDVSERRKLDQLRANFVATVSHELRTPLTTIIGYTDLLVGMPTADLKTKAAPLLANVRTHSAAMQRLVEALLEVTTIQADGMTLVRRPVGIDLLLRIALEDVPVSPRHTLRLDVAEGLGTCVIDPERLGRVVTELITNAVKYSPEGGTVTLKVGMNTEGDLAIAVSDEGIGIAPEDIEGLFDRFIQGDMSSTRSYGGLGLGLFVANEIVMAHGGRIDVASELGKGSTFTLIVPCE